MTDVVIERVNEVYVRIHADPGIKMELSEYFEFEVPNARFIPAVKAGYWDGKIRLLNYMTGLIYSGLLGYIKKYCETHDYTLTVDADLLPSETYNDDAGYELANEFNAPFEPYYYQNKAVAHGIHNNRCLFLSPTASGKSFTIYLLARYHVQSAARRILIVVPTISLVSQLSTDFIEYNNNVPMDIHKITSGVDKNVEADYTITTWQSIQKLPASWFEKFDVIFGDEAHNFKAKSLTKILENTPNIKYRYGLTGSLDDSQTHRLVLEGLFGPVMSVTDTKTLMDEGIVSKLKIKAMVLQYDDASRKSVHKLSYPDEIEWIISHHKRNKFISKLADAIEGNTLILYQFVERHGDVLVEMLREITDKNIHYVHGGVSAAAREEIRAICEKTSNNIILASYGTFSTGINIKRLDNIITASPSKSKIRNLQSIGRVLRIYDDVSTATLYDIVDDLQWKKRANFATRHFMERVKTYNEQQFDMKIYNIPIKG